MNTKLDLEDEFVQDVVRDVVRVGLISPLRDPILEAVEGVTGQPVAPADSDVADDEQADDEESETGGRGSIARGVRGLLVFAVLATVMYLVLQRFAGDDPA